MTTTTNFNYPGKLLKEMWNSMTLTSRLLAIPVMALLLIGSILTGIIVLSMSVLLSVYSLAVE